MTTSDETVATEVASAEDLSAKHLAFKQRAMEIAHNYATGAGHCETFDQILHDLGIPGREKFYNNGGCCDDPACGGNAGKRLPPTLVGEETEAEFNAWKYRTAKKLYDEAARHGIITFVQPMSEAGFPTRTDLQALTQSVNVEVSGKFTFTMPVQTIEGIDLIEFIDTETFPRSFRIALGVGDVEWKATVAQDEES